LLLRLRLRHNLLDVISGKVPSFNPRSKWPASEFKERTDIFVSMNRLALDVIIAI
jgi:hypothetical protein